MSAAKTKSIRRTKNARHPGGPQEEVLTLSEAAAYLRISEAEVLSMMHTQGLIGRQIGDQWRFLKTALQVDESACVQFDMLRSNKKLSRKIGAGDLLIASIALSRKATLITRNLRDFRQVPVLQFDNWAD